MADPPHPEQSSALPQGLVLSRLPEGDRDRILRRLGADNLDTVQETEHLLQVQAAKLFVTVNDFIESLQGTDISAEELIGPRDDILEVVQGLNDYRLVRQTIIGLQKKQGKAIDRIDANLAVVATDIRSKTSDEAGAHRNAEALHGLIESIQTYISGGEGSRTEAGKLIEVTELLGRLEIVNATGPITTGLTTVNENLNTGFSTIRTGFQDVTESLQDVSATVNDSTDKMKELGEAMTATNDRVIQLGSDLAAGFTDITESLQDVSAMANDSKDRVTELGEAMAATNNRITQLGVDVDTTTVSVEALTTTLEDHTTATDSKLDAILQAIHSRPRVAPPPQIVVSSELIRRHPEFDAVARSIAATMVQPPSLREIRNHPDYRSDLQAVARAMPPSADNIRHHPDFEEHVRLVAEERHRETMAGFNPTPQQIRNHPDYQTAVDQAAQEARQQARRDAEQSFTPTAQQIREHPDYQSAVDQAAQEARQQARREAEQAAAPTEQAIRESSLHRELQTQNQRLQRQIDTLTPRPGVKKGARPGDLSVDSSVSSKSPSSPSTRRRVASAATTPTAAHGAKFTSAATERNARETDNTRNHDPFGIPEGNEGQQRGTADVADAGAGASRLPGSGDRESEPQTDPLPPTQSPDPLRQIRTDNDEGIYRRDVDLSVRPRTVQVPPVPQDAPESRRPAYLGPHPEPSTTQYPRILDLTGQDPQGLMTAHGVPDDAIRAILAYRAFRAANPGVRQTASNAVQEYFNAVERGQMKCICAGTTREGAARPADVNEVRGVKDAPYEPRPCPLHRPGGRTYRYACITPDDIDCDRIILHTPEARPGKIRR
ncbi:hypothetical protein CAC42_5024 [Sphaceloma murrayae]|uniref:Uncharacterized protein n=1 Tax=Sphaceloma murrayae TaxID=2082308 RepID=A0A2K1QQ59_9PEZI|nr:hypothetical protein CAC42_5024 [Sphaceloma murrayae]